MMNRAGEIDFVRTDPRADPAARSRLGWWWLARGGDGICAALLLTLAIVKLIDPEVSINPHGLLLALVEAGIGASLLVPASRSIGYVAMTLLGVGFCAWTAADGMFVMNAGACRCFGEYDLGPPWRMIVASTIAGLGATGVMLHTGSAPRTRA